MRDRLNSFRHAFRGIGTLVVTQPNARIHLAALVCVLGMGILTGLTVGEWALIALAAAMVLATEAMNSALEFLADHTAPEWHEAVRRAKDLAAAAVLLASMGALSVGLLVLLPHWM
jgi:diacylglycerol kinase (ATP)